MIEVCPHGANVRPETGGWTRDPETGLWVHGDPECRRPSRGMVRFLVQAAGGFAF